MEQVKKTRRRRLNIVTRTARTKRIFARLREGWAYDDIAKDKRLSAERVRQIVGQVLENRVLDRGDDHAHMQIERLRPALRIVGKAVADGNLKAIGPLIKLIDRLDKHQGVLTKPFALHRGPPQETARQAQLGGREPCGGRRRPRVQERTGRNRWRGSALSRANVPRRFFLAPVPPVSH